MMMMKARETKAQAPPSADLLVCFPSRAHLTLMPKPICSPARASDSNKRHQRKKSISRGAGGGGGGGGLASPLLWAKTKPMGPEIAEPTSPKVTCAGQIKVRPKTTACRSWQSVMEEIEKIHNDKKQRKRLNWAHTLGFKKEVMQFLTCLRSIRFDLRCFGSFSGTDVTTDDEEEEDEEEEEDDDEEYKEGHVAGEESEKEGSRTVFSKWFMVLQEEQSNRGEGKEKDDGDCDGDGSSVSVPPPNALLLMRCRSAPAKSWLRESEGGKKENVKREKGKGEIEEVKKGGQSLKSLMEEEKEKLVLMRCESEFYGISSEIAKETWIVGELRDSIARSRSSKR